MHGYQIDENLTDDLWEALSQHGDDVEYAILLRWLDLDTNAEEKGWQHHMPERARGFVDCVDQFQVQDP